MYRLSYGTSSDGTKMITLRRNYVILIKNLFIRAGESELDFSTRALEVMYDYIDGIAKSKKWKSQKSRTFNVFGNEI